jgi:hypothetical protein
LHEVALRPEMRERLCWRKYDGDSAERRSQIGIDECNGLGKEV